MNKNNNQQGGFLKIILIIIVVVFLMSYFNITISGIFNWISGIFHNVIT